MKEKKDQRAQDPRYNCALQWERKQVNRINNHLYSKTEEATVYSAHTRVI